ncbi:MAG: cache domain-containing protein, partial [Syntrophales bacterium]
MITTTRRLQKISGRIFQWRSLRTKLTLLTLAIFLTGIWSLAFYASQTLRRNMKQALGEQQFSTVSIIAEDINDELNTRLKTIEMMAEKITPTMLGNASATQAFLDSRITFKLLFNYGVIVARLDGIVIADLPISGRIGVNYSDRDWMIEALKGKTVIGKPVMGKTSHSPILPYAAPIRDTQGKVIGVVAATTDLGKPNFLTKITDHRYGKTGGYLLVSPKIRTIVYATDKKRIMEVLPAPGRNQLIDRFVQGYEGSGVAVCPNGVEALTSAKGIPVSGWYVEALMPTEEAFAPIYAMQSNMLLATIFLTLLAGGLTWWMLKHQLAPALTTIKTLATLADVDQVPQPLPITRQDEIGDLIDGFNRLLETLGKREEALQESDERNRTLFSRAADGIFIMTTDGMLTEVNESFARMHGYSTDEMLLMSLKDFDTPATAQLSSARMGRLITGETLAFEVEHYHRDGHI